MQHAVESLGVLQRLVRVAVTLPLRILVHFFGIVSGVRDVSNVGIGVRAGGGWRRRRVRRVAIKGRFL